MVGLFHRSVFRTLRPTQGLTDTLVTFSMEGRKGPGGKDVGIFPPIIIVSEVSDSTSNLLNYVYFV